MEWKSTMNHTPAPAALAITHDVGTGITVRSGAATLMRYRYSPEEAQFESPRPYIHPVSTLGGRLVSVFRPHDHVWHKGIALSLPNVGPDNFWGGATYRRGDGYVQLDNNGSMDHQRVTAIAVDDAFANFAHDLVWHTQAGNPIINEHRALRVELATADDAWTLRFDTTLTNVSAASIRIGSPTTEGRENAGYGGLFWRGPRSFTGGTVIGEDGTEGEDVRGKRGVWAGFSGKHDDVDGESTVVMVDAERNPQHPPHWFVRSEPFACLNPAPFFSEEFEFAAGATVAFSYAVVVADGRSDHARMARLAEYGRSALAAVEPNEQKAEVRA
jgi:hypothetical protein